MNKSIRGFTLVELMVVIAIIAILTAILTVNFTQSKGKARDAKRVSDIAQIQLALEQYFDRCGQYPLSIADTTASNGCPSSPTQITLGSYISQIPKPPSIQPAYDYVTNEATNSGVPTDYILHTTLEYSNTAVGNSLSVLNGGTIPSYGQSWSCYDSTHPLDYCVNSR